ncbi:hypothetical protein D7V97_20055 [Corallococcus sp. CA053C]|nr:hypothetical protein D7V97_20055 [Corallococcus sp. CA053C]
MPQTFVRGEPQQHSRRRAAERAQARAPVWGAGCQGAAHGSRIQASSEHAELQVVDGATQVVGITMEIELLKVAFLGVGVI